MFNSVNDISLVQRQRGRGNAVLRVVDKSGQESFVPPDDSNRHRQMINEWIAEGGTIRDAPPKPTDANRPTATAYLPHPSFHLPDDDGHIAWRYFTEQKFRSLLDTSSLFFARGHVLRAIDDAEGTLPNMNLVADPSDVLQQVYGQTSGMPPDTFARHRSLTEALGRYVFISCWNRSDTESKGMWKTFANDPGAVKKRLIGIKRRAHACSRGPTGPSRACRRVSLLRGTPRPARVPPRDYRDYRDNRERPRSATPCGPFVAHPVPWTQVCLTRRA